MMKKKLAMAAAGIMVIGLLTGCGGKTTETQESDTGQEASAGEENDVQEPGGGG